MSPCSTGPFTDFVRSPWDLARQSLHGAEDTALEEQRPYRVTSRVLFGKRVVGRAMDEVISHPLSTLDQHSLNPGFYDIFQCSLEMCRVSGTCCPPATVTFGVTSAHHLDYTGSFLKWVSSFVLMQLSKRKVYAFP